MVGRKEERKENVKIQKRREIEEEEASRRKRSRKQGKNGQDEYRGERNGGFRRQQLRRIQEEIRNKREMECREHKILDRLDWESREKREKKRREGGIY